ncbi:unnamed protein product [Lactuca saligna]|uniref:Uncharacterized protein n=1 Tax=Lactuca saligna TaxID=75948 RepID=A0AA35YPV1_LACSI|nr:unnamed protein product [Lactuca saligna]
MSPFPLKGHPTRPHKNMHRLLQRYTTEASTPTMRPATSTYPLFVPYLPPPSASAPLFSTLSPPSSTSATSSSPSSTTNPSSTPSSTIATSTPVATEQQDAQLEQRLHITVRANALLSSEKIPVVVSDSVIKAAWEQKAKERYRRCKGVVGGKAPPTHNGGSASHQQIVADMLCEEYTGKAPSCYELFMFTYIKDHDGKTFQVDKANEVHDLIVSRRADLALLGEEVPKSELFYAAVG